MSAIIPMRPWRNLESTPIKLFAMSGPGIEAGQSIEAHIADVLPTLLYALNLPIPDDIDGQVLENIFTQTWRETHPIEIQDHGAIEMLLSQSEANYSAAEQALLHERLKSLGYVE